MNNNNNKNLKFRITIIKSIKINNIQYNKLLLILFQK